MNIEKARIGDWVLDTHLNRIYRGEESVALEPLASAVLAHLAANAGQVVSPDDLIENLWQRKFVGDNPVYRIIAELRRALDDNAREPFYIETIRKRGYRLIAAVEVLDPAPAKSTPSVQTTAVPDQEPIDAGASLTRRRYASIGVIGVCLMVTALLGWRLFDAPAPQQPAVQAPVVAVLPFESLSNETSSPLSRGLTDAVATRIAGVAGIRVISQNSSRQFEAASATTGEIAESLGANYLLTGTTLVATSDGEPERIRLNAHLVDVVSDSYLWSETYDLDIADIFEIQTEISERVAQQLDFAIAEASRQYNRPHPQAFEEYLLGRDAYSRGFRESDLEESITQLQQAVAIDPDYAQAHAMLGLAHLQLYAQYWDRSDARLAQARGAIDRALELDQGLIDGHFGLGSYYLRLGLLEPASEHLKMVLKSRPSHTEALVALAQVHQRTGDLSRAVDALDDAARFDPLSHLTLYMLGQTQIVAGDYAAAEASLERAITLRPDLAEGYLFKAVVYMAWRGDEARAAEEMQRAYHELGADALMAFLLQPGVSSAFRFAGDELREALREMEFEGSGLDPSAYYMARAELAEIDRKPGEARKYYNLARIELEKVVNAVPDEPLFRALLGSAYAGAGMTDEALETGSMLLAMAPVDDNPWDNADYLWYLAEIHLLCGRYDDAIQWVETALQYQTTNTLAWIQAEPFWEPVREMPRFRALMDAR